MTCDVLPPDSAASMIAAVQKALLKPTIDRHADVASSVAVEDAADDIKLWFVRVPRPAPVDDAKIKQLQEAFAVEVEKVKAMNSKLGAKRDALRALRAQMSEARALRDTVRPEFDDKLNRLKQLRELRNGYQTQLSEIRSIVKGLDCRTEQELDARIKQQEEKIRFGAATIREEKLVVGEIAKLRGQREHIKQFEQHKASLEDLEAENAKVKSAIEELDTEFGVIKGERDAAAKVATDFHTKGKAMEKELEALEERQKEAVEKKNVVLAQLEAAKLEREGSSQDYRENRKFSLLIREMVDKGQVDAARELCAKQVDTLMAQLSSDSSFHSAYCKAVAEQRKSVVSMLLPESSTSAAAAATMLAAEAAVKTTGASKAAAAAAAAPAPKPVANGAEKAKQLIASIMQQASAEAAIVKASIVDEEQDFDDEADKTRAPVAANALPPAKPAAAAAPPKLVENAAAKAAEVFGFKNEVLKFDETEFAPPPPKLEAEAMSKEEVREEQRVKSLDAEARKKKRQETTDKKKAKAIQMQKKAEDDEQVSKLVAPAEEAAPAEPVQEPAPLGDLDAAKPAAAAEPAVVKPKQTMPQMITAAKLVPPAAKRPASKASILRKLQKFFHEYQNLLVLAAVLALILALVMLS